jgi:hypothetical protein
MDRGVTEKQVAGLVAGGGSLVWSRVAGRGEQEMKACGR